MGFSSVPSSVSQFVPVEWSHHRIDIVQPVIAIQPGMDEYRVAGAHRAFPNYAPIAQARSVVGLQQARKVRLQLFVLVVRRIDMQHAPAFIGHWLGAGAHSHDMLGFSRRAVRVGEFQATFILRAPARD